MSSRTIEPDYTNEGGPGRTFCLRATSLASPRRQPVGHRSRWSHLSEKASILVDRFEIRPIDHNSRSASLPPLTNEFSVVDRVLFIALPLSRKLA
ncbi:hypothetical protein AVEN_581-1 [Araneus ventricosus]|uniref:Uncharacterized protein n=1 Tax=Araneus ventricosus TaxID=182803 RepID=A0A4Y2GLA1_ARAVE|nr:hypothetical protein AVEN_581-1 [Araneus ventricosus]